ncbi:MAG: HAD family phosphatase [Bacteroidetes bacterium HGW-Bacteroidetes-16]|jgi:putative hydrolase of the HAD superfamily|nr:MAG: HAD family phosphatase [Bacteroidetes bacterium HGW-Bacteroidetes-16]
MKIKNIIFDFGGVILDIDPQLTINELINLGLKNPEKLLTSGFMEDIAAKFERGILTPEVFRTKLRNFLQVDATDQQLDEAWNALLFDIPSERIAVIEQVKKHYLTLLLSNSNEIHYDLFVRDLQLRFGYREFDELFHKAYFSFDLHLSKPNPEVYEFVINQHDLDPGKTLFIDDREDNIEVAQQLGFKTYLLQKPERVRDLFVDGKLKPSLNIK